MLPAGHRVRAAEDFRRALRGVRVSRPTLVLHMRTGSGSGPARVGFVVSRAVGTAVVRNRVRRRLREQVRARHAALPASSLVVVRALPAAALASSARLGSDLDGALSRLPR